MKGKRATGDAAGVEPRLSPSEVASPPEYRLLVVHDRATGADEAIAHLESSGLRLRALRVDTLPALDAALRGRDWDLVLLARPLERIADEVALVRLTEAADTCPVIVLGDRLDDETILELSAAGVSDVVEAGAGGRLLEAVQHALVGHEGATGERDDAGLRLAARIQDVLGTAESLEDGLAQTLELVCSELQQPYGEAWVRVPGSPEFRPGPGFAAHAGLERLRTVTGGRAGGGRTAGGTAAEGGGSADDGRTAGGGTRGAAIPFGIVREVVASRRSRVLTDLSRDDGRRFDRSGAALASGLGAATAVPVVVRGVVEAVMLALGPLGHAPDPRVRGVMEVAAKHLAGSLGCEREKATLSHERRRLEALLDLLGEGVMACDRDGQVTLFNRTLEQFHGRRAARGIARDEWPRAYALYLADGVTAMRPEEVPMLRALAGEAVEHERLVIAAPGVRRRTVRASARPLRDASGAIDGALMVVHDESQMAAASEALAGASERAVRTFTLLLDHLADLALRVGEAHRLADAWPAFADFAERTLGADELRVIRSDASLLDAAEAVPCARMLFAAVRPATVADVLEPEAAASALARDAIAAGRLAIERDASYAGLAPQRPMRSAAAVPMVLGERILGALEVRAARPFAFDEGAAVALTMAATLAAIALDHADLVEEERRSRELAEASARHFQQIFVANPAAVAIVAAGDGRVLDANPAMEVLTGCARAQLFGRSAVELGLWRTEDASSMALAPGGAATLRERETLLRRSDGAQRTCLVSVEATLLRSGDASERALLVLAIDVTERLEQQKQLGDLARFRESLMEFIAQTLSHGFDETFYQRLLEAAVRATPGAVAGSLLLRDAPDSGDRLVAEVPRERGDDARGGHAALEVPIELDGQQMALLCLESGAGDAGFDERAEDLAAAFATQAATLIQRRALERELQHMAYHDSLTGLPNRTLFRDRLQQAVTRSQRTGRRGAALFVDLDNLKVTNDTLGHGVGDALLQAVGERLRSAVRAEDTVARIGGDEFTLVLPEAEDAAAAALVAEKILRAMRQPFVLLGHELHVSVSMGITLFPDDATDADTLIRHGDAALYHAKAQGKDRYRFFTLQMNQELLERASLEARLRIALQRDEFGLRYQPRVSLVDGRITSVEALARWHLPERGEVPPATFIAVAEEARLIGPLGTHLLRLACRQGRAWSDAGTPTVVAVNLSAKQLQERDVVRTVLAVLRECGLDPSLLELELTESAVMRNVEENVVKLGELRDLGVHISIDDFGTAYSSLNYLKQLPATALKIDQSFVRDVAATGEAGRHDTAIVRAVVALAKALELVAIAEGVETKAQLRFLRDIGCEQAQGYLLARPAAASELAELLRRGRVELPDNA